MENALKFNKFLSKVTILHKSLSRAAYVGNQNIFDKK